MAKYKVSYSGFCYVEADDIIQAGEDYEYANIYEEKQIDSIEKVDDFYISLFD